MLKKFRILLLLLFLFAAALAACSGFKPPAEVSHSVLEPAVATTAAEDVETPSDAMAELAPDIASLPKGWTKIEPGGETRCAHDTDFAFWVRPGISEHLLLYFEGGGGCWDAATCAPNSTFFDNDVNNQDAPTARGGVLEIDHPENPFADYNMVFIPSCTGDVHWGTNVVQFPKEDGTELTMHFNGFVNAQSALDWAYQNFADPESVFITGCSAGSVGSAAHAPYIIENYPDTRVTQLGDSLAFVFHRPLNLTEYGTYDNLPDWVPGLESLQPGNFTMAGYYRSLANYYPNYVFSQFNTSADRVQDRFYLAVGGQPGEFPGDLLDSLDEIHASTPNFFSYLAGGDAHCVMPADRFYTYSTNGVRLRDWVADLAAGTPVESVRCTDCDRADTVSP